MNNVTRAEEQTVLLATPCAKAARLVSSTFQRLSVSTTVVADGQSVINHLTTELTDVGDSTVPDLIILDPPLAEVDAETVVTAIKSSPSLGYLPVILLSSDANPTHRETTYALGVNAYVPTPDDIEGYAEVIERLATFWLENATLPP